MYIFILKAEVIGNQQMWEISNFWVKMLVLTLSSCVTQMRPSLHWILLIPFCSWGRSLWSQTCRNEVTVHKDLGEMSASGALLCSMEMKAPDWGWGVYVYKSNVKEKDLTHRSPQNVTATVNICAVYETAVQHLFYVFILITQLYNKRAQRA